MRVKCEASESGPDQHCYGAFAKTKVATHLRKLFVRLIFALALFGGAQATAMGQTTWLGDVHLKTAYAYCTPPIDVLSGDVVVVEVYWVHYIHCSREVQAYE